MAIAAGTGAAVWWNGSPVEELESAEPEFGFEMQDSTSCGDAAGEQTATVQNPKLSFTFRLDTSKTVQNAIRTDFLAKTSRAVRFYETAAKYYVWNATIESMKQSVNAKGLVTYTVTINGTSDGVAATYN